MDDEDDPFADYHRHRRRQGVIRFVATVAPLVAVSLLLGWAASAGGAGTAQVDPGGYPSSPSPSGSPSAEFATLPAEPSPAPSPSATATPPPASAGAREWAIAIDTVGYQAELDACQWVRMDLSAVAPIVGAHNYCGGGIVLEMAEGDTVTLTGTQLDGAYRVTGEREAHAGDNAATATEGLVADVILQTCHWNSGGRERLLTLVRV